LDAWFLFSAMLTDEMVGASVPILSTFCYLRNYVSCEINFGIVRVEDLHGFSSSDIGLIYSASFVPSLTAVICGGFFFNKIGVRLMAVVAAILQLSGCLLFIMTDTFYGKIAGRVLFGFGLGPQEVKSLFFRTIGLISY
jgi:MFS family permease